MKFSQKSWHVCVSVMGFLYPPSDGRYWRTTESTLLLLQCQTTQWTAQSPSLRKTMVTDLLSVSLAIKRGKQKKTLTSKSTCLSKRVRILTISLLLLWTAACIFITAFFLHDLCIQITIACAVACMQYYCLEQNGRKHFFPSNCR